jgi:hypothetical protein
MIDTDHPHKFESISPDSRPGAVCGCGRHRLLSSNHIIHVCATCGRACDANGTWVDAGPFIAAHPDLAVEFVELLCADCVDRAAVESSPA